MQKESSTPQEAVPYIYGLVAFLKKHSMQQISSIPPHPGDSPRSTVVVFSGSFRSPHGPSSQLPWTPVDSQPCPRYESLQPGLSVWFSLRSDGHRLVGSLPNSFKWLLIPVDGHGRGELSPALQLPQPQVQAGPTCSPTPFLFLLVPSFFCLTKFCMNPDIPPQ